MISYERAPQQTIPESSVKIIGLGGAGSNMLDRVALDGLTGAETACIHTDIRTLSSSVAGSKIQIGKDYTKGLGCGGDPDLAQQAAQESEAEIREAVQGHKIIFLCVGLGGGTGSGAAPLIVRIAREENAFVVVFATMPFSFEGRRRREQAETALNELAVLANALVTFDNGRMGELVLAKQGIHEAFAAADQMISESIKAVTRLVVRPGIINIGLDELMTALRTTRSRCLFGSGIAKGENRSHLALENALTSPLLDKGGLLSNATTVLVHICGGESLTLYEVELLMQNLEKYIPSTAHVLFGTAVDPSMGDMLSVTLISALPEDQLIQSTSPVSTPTIAVEPSPEITSKKEVEAETAKANTENPEEEVPASKAELKTSVEEPKIEVEEIEPEETKEEPQAQQTEEENPEVEQKEDQAIEKEEQEQDKEASAEEATDTDNEAYKPETTTEAQTAKQKSEAQAELELGGAPKGKFEGEDPNFHEGEDLDIPPFLRKKRG